jgi:hypothetical protein
MAVLALVLTNLINPKDQRGYFALIAVMLIGSLVAWAIERGSL